MRMGIEPQYQQYQELIHKCDYWQLDHASQRQINASQSNGDIHHHMQVNHFDSGILLSRLNGQGRGSYSNHIEHFAHNVSFFVLLEGRNTITLGHKKPITASPDEIWLVTDDWHDATEHITTTNNKLCALHIDFDTQRLQKWQDEGMLCNNELLSAPNYRLGMTRLAQNTACIRSHIQQIAQHSGSNDLVSQLELESATLSLAAKLFNMRFDNRENHKLSTYIDEAVDIIQAEFMSPLTIASIAKRVGINECYLKQYFKQRTGETISQYIRRLRLECAFSLLTEQNKSIKETMFFVGYRHIGHFNDVFFKRFGVYPKQVKS